MKKYLIKYIGLGDIAITTFAFLFIGSLFFYTNAAPILAAVVAIVIVATGGETKLFPFLWSELRQYNLQLSFVQFGKELQEAPGDYRDCKICGISILVICIGVSIGALCEDISNWFSAVAFTCMGTVLCLCFYGFPAYCIRLYKKSLNN